MEGAPLSAPGTSATSQDVVKCLLILALVFAVGIVLRADPQTLSTKVLTAIDLNDQYDAPRSLRFPTTNITVLAIADRKGAAQVDDWIATLKLRYGGRIDIRGLADVGGVPGFLRGRIRKKFQETRSHPVMMDWSGKVCARLGYQPGVANLLVLGGDGTILARFLGAASDAAVREACVVLDTALLKARCLAPTIGVTPP